MTSVKRPKHSTENLLQNRSQSVLSFPLPLARLPSRSPSILSESRSSLCSLPLPARTDFRLILGLENAGSSRRFGKLGIPVAA